jgi:hypothetical protein
MKKERRENPQLAIEEEKAKAVDNRKRRALLWGTPLFGLVISGVGYASFDSDAMLGVGLLVGIGGWIVVYLSELGQTIPKKDSSASAAIEFGRSK